MTEEQFYDGLAPATLAEDEINRFVSIHNAVCEILQNLSNLLCCPEQRAQHLMAIRENAAHISRHAGSAPEGAIKEAADD